MELGDDHFLVMYKLGLWFNDLQQCILCESLVDFSSISLI